MRISIDTSELRGLSADLRDIGKKVPFALVAALTQTALEVKAAEQEEMRSVFDRPTPFTLNGLYVRAATKTRPTAEVGVKDGSAINGGKTVPPNKYLAAEVYSGPRRLKAMEKQLQDAGLMPKGWFAVPGRFARLDSFGNVARGQIIQILSQLRITSTAGYTRNIPVGTDKKTRLKRARAFYKAGGQFFALPDGRGKLKPGIYQRRDGALGHAAPRPVFIFVPSVSYRRRLDFYGVAERTTEVFIETKLAEAFEKYPPLPPR